MYENIDWTKDVTSLKLNTHWLEILQTQSITSFLKNISDDFRVELVSFGLNDAKIEDFIHPLTREVFLFLNEKRVLYAKSICDNNSKFWKNVLDCQTKPLGEILFAKDTNFKREPFLYGFKNGSPIRCSVFSYGDEKMLLMEHFLSDLEIFL